MLHSFHQKSFFFFFFIYEKEEMELFSSVTLDQCGVFVQKSSPDFNTVIFY